MTKLSPEEWKAARSLKEIGKSYTEIAGILGCSRSQIGHGLNHNRDQVKRNLSLELKKWAGIPNDPRMKEGGSFTREEKVSEKTPTRDRIVEALKQMKENDKNSFTTQDLKKIMPDVSLTEFSNYLSGRRGDPPIYKEIPFKRVGKINGQSYVTYTFSDGQTVLPKGKVQVFDARSDHDILMDLKARVEKMEAGA